MKKLVINDIKINGKEKYSLQRPSVIVSNHNCLLDIFCVPYALENIVSLISARLVYKNGDRKQLIEQYLNAMPIEAHGGKIYSDMCLQEAVNIVDSGFSVNIFPEGAYVDGTVVHRGRTGAARILFESMKHGHQVDFIPVSIDIKGLDSNLDTLDMTGKEVTVNFLDKIDVLSEFDKYMYGNDKIRNDALHSIIDQAMRDIADSLGRQYLNEYIELTPKGNVIFSSADVIDTALAQSDKYIDMYHKELNERTKTIIKRLKSQM